MRLMSPSPREPLPVLQPAPDLAKEVGADAAFRLDGPDATTRFAARVADLARAGDAVCLWGDLGAGKTHFARGFIEARLGVRGLDVPSPTFTLVQRYEDREHADIHHFDLYRLEAPEEAFELGLEEALDQGIALIEWPVRLGTLLPADRLDILLRLGQHESERLALCSAHGSWRARLDRLSPHA